MSLSIISGLQNEINARQQAIASLVPGLDARDYITHVAGLLSSDEFRMEVLEVPGTDGQVSILKYGRKGESSKALAFWTSKVTEQGKGHQNNDLVVTCNGLKRGYSFVRNNDKEVRESAAIGQAIYECFVAQGVGRVLMPNADEAASHTEFEVQEATGDFLCYGNNTARIRSNRGHCPLGDSFRIKESMAH
jgi:hypothetical protein